VIRGRVGIYDCVDAGHLLPDHEHDGDDGAAAVPGDGPHFLEQALGRGVAHQRTLVLQLVGHLLDLVSHVLVVCGESGHVGQHRPFDEAVIWVSYPRSREMILVVSSQLSCLAVQRGLSGTRNMKIMSRLNSFS